MSLPIEVAQIAATTFSLFLSGAISSVSMVTIPVAIQTSTSNPSLAQTWKTIYLAGHRQGPIIATVVGVAHNAIAFEKSRHGEDPTCSILAAAFTAGIVPFTWTVMVPTNNRLMNAANNGVGLESTRHLVGTWRFMNMARGLLPMIGGVLSLIGMARLL